MLISTDSHLTTHSKALTLDIISFLADACIKAAIALIADLPLSYEQDGVLKSNEPFILEYVKNVLSTLLVLPVRLRRAIHKF